MLMLEERGKPKYPKADNMSWSKDKIQQPTLPTVYVGFETRNQTRALLAGDE